MNMMVTQTQVKNLENNKIDIDKQDNLWSSILHEVRNQNKSKLHSCKNVLVLGDNESGKTTLVAKLQGVEDPRKGSALEYAYIDVRDDYRDDTTRLSVWVLDGDIGHDSLARFALTKESFRDTLVILTVSMMNPWGIMDQLQHWSSILSDHIDKLSLDADDLQNARSCILSRWQNYTEPGDDCIDTNSPVKRQKTNMYRSSTFEFEESGDIWVEEGALAINLGVDIIVVLTKTDYMATLEKELDYRDEHWDFMQQCIRRFCLSVGAALFYTSAKEDKNCDLLYKYLTHRIYGLPFQTPALVVEKDALFIPAGWDNFKKISILHENLLSCKPNDVYSSVISPPFLPNSAESRENEIIVEDEQTFLYRQQVLLQIAVNTGGSSMAMRVPESPLRNQNNLMPPRISIVTGQSPKKIECHKLAPGGQSALACFFNSLLTKPTSITTSTTSSFVDASNTVAVNCDQMAMLRSDVAAEVDRFNED